MKNSTLLKGFAAIALGGGLLLGGGGTLASWNAEASQNPGTITSGDLDIVPVANGKWKSGGTDIANIASYKVVPGEKLTYTQDLNVTLVGEKMTASITTTGAGTSTFNPTNVEVSPSPTLTLANGSPLPNMLTADPGAPTKTVTATVTFEFKASTSGRDDVSQSYDFGAVGFTLTQSAPTA